MTFWGKFRVLLAVLSASLTFGAAAASAATLVDPSPGALDLGERTAGLSYQPGYLTLFGTVDPGVYVEDVAVDGPDQAAFEVDWSDCVDWELWGMDDFASQCSISAQLTTTEDPGAYEAALTVSTSDGDPLVVPLTAELTAAAANRPEFGEPTFSAGVDANDFRGLVTGDLNGDGRDDAIDAGQMTDWSLAMGTAFGQEDGSLGPTTGHTFEAGGFPGNPVTGDFDGDEDLDVAVSGNGSVHVYLNDGTGQMTAGQTFVTDAFSDNLGAGDFDGDDELDLIVLEYETLRFFGGAGDGTFEPGEVQSDSEFDAPMGIATGDFGGPADGFAFTSWSGRTYVYVGDGDGTFTRVYRTPGCGCESPEGVAATDLNRDGRLDLVVGTSWDGNVQTILADEEGGFERRQALPMPGEGGAFPTRVAAGDLNGDGKPDVVVTDYQTDTLSVLVGNGDGTLSWAWEITPDLPQWGLREPVVADFNGDGRNDVGAVFDGSGLTTLVNAGLPSPIAEPDDLEFFETVSGSTSAPLTVTLHNAPELGRAPMKVTSMLFGGGASSDFVVTGEDCTAALVPVGDSCEIAVAFKPNSPIPETMTSELAVFVDGIEGGMITVPVSGDSVPLAPEGSVAPADVDFGEVEVGHDAQHPGVVLSSTGTYPLEIDSVSLTGGHAADYTAGDGCDVSELEPGQNCTVALSFEPGAVGERQAILEIETSAEHFTVPLSGVGVEQPVLVPEIAVAPASQDFGQVAIGREAATRTLTVESVGTAPLAIAGVSVGGAAAGDFPVRSNDCPASLAPGVRCTLGFGFVPTGEGVRSAQVSVESDAVGGTAAVSLLGVGVAKPPVPAPVVSFKRKPKKRIVIRSKRLKKLRIAFRADQPGSKFQCRLDGKKWARCKSPRRLKNLKPGKHTFRVRASKDGQTGKARAVSFKIVRKRRRA